MILHLYPAKNGPIARCSKPICNNWAYGGGLCRACRQAEERDQPARNAATRFCAAAGCNGAAAPGSRFCAACNERRRRQRNAAYNERRRIARRLP